MKFDLPKIYGPKYISDGGLAFLYTDPEQDVI